ncbi:MAG: hypothetical protein JRI32_01575 [Deltaproteobacteria bacterium]|nr:hypothetical protein [Deltaproteobacteria bacterium]
MSYSPDSPKIIQWIIKYSGGLIKNEKQANYFVLGFVGLLILISIILISGNLGSTHPSPKNTEYNPSSGYGGRELPDNFR